MDNVLADTLKANLKNASTPDAKLDALVLAMIAMVDCQYKTGQRVKRQGMWLAAIGLVLLISLICGDAEALKLVCFWSGAGGSQ